MQETEKSLDEVCKSLDNLTIQNLELIEEKVQLSIQLEHLLRQGHIDLAKARYIRGKESIGMLQVPSQETDMKSMFNLETNFDKSNKEIPIFDISLKKAAKEKEEKSEKDEEEVVNPIKWFGVLVPQSLKSAQKHFQDALYLSVKLANVQAQLNKINRDTDSLRVLKKVAV